MLIDTRSHGFVTTDHEQLLRGIAPPAVGMFEMFDEFGGLFVEHARLRSGRISLVHHAPDAAGRGPAG